MSRMCTRCFSGVEYGMGMAVAPMQRTCKAEGGVEERGNGKGEKQAGGGGKRKKKGACWGKGRGLEGGGAEGVKGELEGGGRQ